MTSPDKGELGTPKRSAGPRARGGLVSVAAIIRHEWQRTSPTRLTEPPVPGIVRPGHGPAISSTSPLVCEDVAITPAGHRWLPESTAVVGGGRHTGSSASHGSLLFVSGTADPSTTRVLDRLRSVGSQVTGGGTRATCPAHDDHNASLSIGRGTRRNAALLHCHAGCTIDQILESLGLRVEELFDDQRDKRNGYTVEAEYEYTDAEGVTLFVKERRYPKDFRLKHWRNNAWVWSMPKGLDPVLFHLPQVLDAVHGNRTVYVVEGEKDVLALEQIGVAATTNYEGAAGPGQKPKWRSAYGDCLTGADVVVIADRDAAGRAHAEAIVVDLTGKARSVRLVEPASGKDVSDHLDAGYGLDELVEIHQKATKGPVSLREVHEVFLRWFGTDYDLEALDAVLATAAVERLGGDPVWLLVVSGSGNAKTETLSALSGAGATVTSTINSEGALLSATSRRERSSDASGGLLRRLGPRGILVIKDFTTIIAMAKETRGSVMAALREIYDGHYERNVGTDGGQSLTWRGRLVVLGAVTTAYDTAHAVVGRMGDRFALVRLDSGRGRMAAGRQALDNIGEEVQMRQELALTVGGLLGDLPEPRPALDSVTSDTLLRVADIVTLVRSPVEHDAKGDVIQAHAAEMPTRFAKMLGQIVLGYLALGGERSEAFRVALRVARDSAPPSRVAVLVDICGHPDTNVAEIVRRLRMPRTTVRHLVEDLCALRAVDPDDWDKPGRYRIALPRMQDWGDAWELLAEGGSGQSGI